MILGLCDRWHKTPPEIEALPGDVWRLLEIERLGVNPDV
jgi:hypothetical protein